MESDNKIAIMDASNEEIYNLFKNRLSIIYAKFSYLDISHDEYRKLVYEIMVDLRDIEDLEVYEKELGRKVVIELIKRTNEVLNDSAVSSQIINKYVLNNLTKTVDYETALSELEEFAKFLMYGDYLPDPDIIIDLINSSDTFNSILDLIVSKNILDIKEGHDVFNNNVMSYIVQIYCGVKNIEIKDDKYILENISEDDYFSDNLYKTYIREIRKIPVLPAEEQRVLALKAKAGSKVARDKLIEHNLRLVVYVVWRYGRLNRDNASARINVLDFIQEGNIGLFKAIEKYDETLEVKFSTYAVWWIRQALTRLYENQAYFIRKPANVIEELDYLCKIMDNLRHKLNREPQITEIVTVFGKPYDYVSKLLKLLAEPLSIEDDEMYNYCGMFKLNHKVNRRNEIPSPENIERDYDKKELVEAVDEVLDTAQFRVSDARKIIEMRFGIGTPDGKPMTLEAIGNVFGVSREAIDQKIQATLKTLRNPRNARKLIDFVEDIRDIDGCLRGYSSYSRKEIQERLKVTPKNVIEEANLYREIMEVYAVNEETIALMIKMPVLYVKRKLALLKMSRVIQGVLITGRIKEIYAFQVCKVRSERNQQELINRILTENLSVKEVENLVTYYNEKSKRENTKAPITNLYTYLMPLTGTDNLEEAKKIINDVLKTLDSEDITTLIRRSGNDLSNMVKCGDWSITDTYAFSSLIDKIKRRLKKGTYFEFDSDLDMTRAANISKILKNPTFVSLSNTLTPTEAMIVAFKLGYIDGKCRSNEEIANFLGISVEELIKVAKEAFIKYRDSVMEPELKKYVK